MRHARVTEVKIPAHETDLRLRGARPHLSLQNHLVDGVDVVRGGRVGNRLLVGRGDQYALQNVGRCRAVAVRVVVRLCMMLSRRLHIQVGGQTPIRRTLQR